MHIPPYYKKPSWQRFFAGAFIGAIIAFIVFIYMYGQFYERWVEANVELRTKVNELEKNNRVLEENKKEIDEQSKQQQSIDSVSITILNLKELKLEKDRLMVTQLEEEIKEDVIHIIGKDVQSVSESYELLISTIENKTIGSDEFSYKAEVRTLILAAPITRIFVDLSISK